LRGVNKILPVMSAALCLAVAPSPALADQPAAVGTGTVGTVDVVVGGQAVRSGLIAPCLTGTTAGNQTDSIAVGQDTWFGSATTSCTRNPDGTASTRVSGQRFETTILARFGGPVIRAKTFTADCDTVENGSRGRIALSGVTGVTVPSNIPVNYEVTIPGTAPGAPPMAVVVVNESIVPSPSDGSLTTNAMHIRLFPQGGPASGNILVGSASCAP
jgi:hypothetical protein